MDRKGFEAAKTEYRRACEKQQELASAKNFTEMKDRWSDFLVAYNRIFTKLQQASKQGESKGWFDKILAERKTNPALSYLLHARNADEHGIADVHEEAPANLQIGAASETVTVNLSADDQGRISGSVIGHGKKPSVLSRPRRIELIDVRDRGVLYSVPVDENSTFRNKYTPVDISSLGINFADRIMREGEKYLQP